MSHKRMAATAAVAALAAALAVGAGPAAAGLVVGTSPSADARTAKTTVNVTLKEWKLTPSLASVKAGKVTFVVSNIGTKMHEFVVIKTNTAAGSLPMDGRQASEAGAVDEIEDLEPGDTGRLTLKLKKGKYVLLCNMPGHYKRGQYAAFTVT